MQTMADIFCSIKPGVCHQTFNKSTDAELDLTFCPRRVVWQTQQGPHSNHTVSNLWRKLLTFFLLQDFKCADCGYSCKLKRDLIKHITASHSREVIFINFIIGGTTRPRKSHGQPDWLWHNCSNHKKTQYCNITGGRWRPRRRRRRSQKNGQW